MLQSALDKLDAWENLQINNLINKSEFLTQQTAEGLRVSLKSMIDLITYLFDKYKFSSVLSGCVNQDALEVCLQEDIVKCSDIDY